MSGIPLELVVEVLRRGEVTSLTDLVGAGAISGSLRIATGKMRRTVNLAVADRSAALVPGDIGDLLAPPSRLRISMRVGEGALTPLGTFGISRPNVTDTLDDLVLTVDAYDATRRISRNRWRKPYAIASGTNLGTALKAAITDRFPGAQFNFAPVTNTLPVVTWGLEVENDPWEDMVALAAEYSHQLYLNASGVFVLRPVIDVDTETPAHTYVEGPGCTMEADSRSYDDEPGFNWVVGHAEGPHLASPLRAEVWDSDSRSPRYAGVLSNGTADPALPDGSEWGIVPRFFTSGVLSTQAELDAACLTYLRKDALNEQQVTISAFPDPTQDVDEAILAGRSRSRLRGRWLTTAVDLPFDGAPMTITAIGKTAL